MVVAAAHGEDPLTKSFHLKEVLGSGTDGRVVRGIARSAWSEVGRSCALKFLKAGDRADWVREVAILKKLKHPHIVPILGSFSSHIASGRQEYVLVFPERESVLSAFLRMRFGQTIPPKVVQQFATQLLSALEHMHFRGILHRDLKPANILMKWDSLSTTAGLVLEICDFGHAREAPHTARVRLLGKQVVDSVGRNVHMPIVGMTPGICTYMYAAPEIWCSGFDASETSYGYGVDVWSYGTIVFQMINLQPFVGGDDDSERFAAVVARLGPCPEGVVLGPRQRELTARALAPSVVIHAETTESLLSYGDPVSGSKWGHIAKALTWSSRYRLSAKALLNESWLSSDGSDKPDGPSDIAGPARPNNDVVLTPPASEQKRSWVTAFSPDPDMWTPEPVAPKKGKCCCSGHCWTSGHRYHKGCDSLDIIKNSRYCKECKCQLRGCSKPRHHGVWCHRHAKVFTELPFPLKATSAARAVLDELMPCDMVTFADVFPLFHENLALCVCAGMLKEPTAVRRWAVSLGAVAASQSHDNEVSAATLFASLSDVVMHVDGAPHKMELDQLSRQGVARFLGVSVWCRELGVVTTEEVGENTSSKKRKKALADPQGPAVVVNLGLMQKPFRMSSECPVEVTDFSDSCMRLQGEFSKLWQDATTVGVDELQVGIRSILETIDSECKLQWTGYVHDSLVRKFVFAAVVHRNTMMTVASSVSSSGDDMPMHVLRRLVADQAGYMRAFPDDFTAGLASDMICGRRDRSLLISMYACLFHEAEKLWCNRHDEILQVLASSECAEAVYTFQRKHGFPPCPTVLLKALLS
jgi:serine/threonine protein kinase